MEDENLLEKQQNGPGLQGPSSKKKKKKKEKESDIYSMNCWAQWYPYFPSKNKEHHNMVFH